MSHRQPKQYFQPEPPECPECRSTLLNLTYDEGEGFWRCNVCRHIWALDTDDPDYDEQDLDELPY